ncbi:MAG: prepilin-type N-terminal cleavage/methylation domain-containing protein [Clostridium sp.]|nr:MAG: prepilin-type N-terminal cleavage/methylation domain-containing protein [Clostridium sp.]
MNKKGFTLVELLAVIAILAILVLVAVPNVLGMFNNAKKRYICY